MCEWKIQVCSARVCAVFVLHACVMHCVGRPSNQFILLSLLCSYNKIRARTYNVTCVCTFGSAQTHPDNTSVNRVSLVNSHKLFNFNAK